MAEVSSAQENIKEKVCIYKYKSGSMLLCKKYDKIK